MTYYGSRNYYEHDDTSPDYCSHGIDRQRADCGPCLAADADAAALPATEPEQPATSSATTEALMRAFRAALDRIQQTEDEQMGVALAARRNQR